MNWLFFVSLSLVAYSLIALFGQLTGGSVQSASQALLVAFKPLPFIVIVAANTVWAVALFWGFKNTTYALPIALSIGVLTTFVYSLIFMHATFNSLKLIGVASVLGGIALLY